MKGIKVPVLREVIFSFITMLTFNLLYETIHKLHEMGQGIGGMVFDSIGIAVLFALFSYAFKNPAGSEDPR